MSAVLSPAAAPAPAGVPALKVTCTDAVLTNAGTVTEPPLGAVVSAVSVRATAALVFVAMSLLVTVPEVLPALVLKL